MYTIEELVDLYIERYCICLHDGQKSEFDARFEARLEIREYIKDSVINETELMKKALNVQGKAFARLRRES